MDLTIETPDQNPDVTFYFCFSSIAMTFLNTFCVLSCNLNDIGPINK